jgi:hypothetical protein
MADDEAEGTAVRKRRRRAKNEGKRRNRRRQRLFYNLSWLLGGLAIGLPLLAMLLLLTSRY